MPNTSEYMLSTTFCKATHHTIAEKFATRIRKWVADWKWLKMAEMPKLPKSWPVRSGLNGILEETSDRDLKWPPLRLPGNPST